MAEHSNVRFSIPQCLRICRALTVAQYWNSGQETDISCRWCCADFPGRPLRESRSQTTPRNCSRSLKESSILRMQSTCVWMLADHSPFRTAYLTSFSPICYSTSCPRRICEVRLRKAPAYCAATGGFSQRQSIQSSWKASGDGIRFANQEGSERCLRERASTFLWLSTPSGSILPYCRKLGSK